MFQGSPKDESSLLKAVKNVHKMIDKELAAGTNPDNVFVCGFSQGGLVFFLSCFCSALYLSDILKLLFQVL